MSDTKISEAAVDVAAFAVPAAVPTLEHAKKVVRRVVALYLQHSQPAELAEQQGTALTLLAAEYDAAGSDKRATLIRDGKDHAPSTAYAGRAITAALAATGKEPVGDGMLPASLVPVADEWYRLCERRFAVDRIRISGKLAEAIVDAVCATPRVQGVGLGKYRDLIGFAVLNVINLPESDPRRDFIRQANELLALIDSQRDAGAEVSP